MQLLQIKRIKCTGIIDEVSVTPDNVKDHLEHVGSCIRTSPFTYA